MSRPPSRGRLKANAVALARLIHSPSTWNGNPVIPAMSVRTKSVGIFALFSISPLVHAGIDSSGGESLDREILYRPPLAHSDRRGPTCAHNPAFVRTQSSPKS